eukprot:m.39064 g.39064  ORF g.39064 m.39064 type:complete len:429 (+) comp12634_c0_seq1:2034-3320(+)
MKEGRTQRYFTKDDLANLFVLDDPSFSATQKQLVEMYQDKYNYAPTVEAHLERLVQMDHVCGFSSHDLLFTESTTQATAAASQPHSPTPSVDADRIERAASKAHAMLTSESQLLATPKSVKKARRAPKAPAFPTPSPQLKKLPNSDNVPSPCAPTSPCQSHAPVSPDVTPLSPPYSEMSQSQDSQPASSPARPHLEIPMLPQLESSDNDDEAGDSDHVSDNHALPGLDNTQTHERTHSPASVPSPEVPALNSSAPSPGLPLATSDHDSDESFHSCTGAPQTPMQALRPPFSVNGALFDSPASFIMSPIARIDMAQPEQEPEPVDADDADNVLSMGDLSSPIPAAATSKQAVCEQHRHENPRATKCTCGLSAGDQAQYKAYLQATEQLLAVDANDAALQLYCNALELCDFDLEVQLAALRLAKVLDLTL